VAKIISTKYVLFKQ